ncbi:hypothetical protein K488DRAFT_83900 [Vararia minispora EC-137]|uniref:Uncharacterized protein n=1 Tax=Vararia minispora EC-137 TaxID=1314806 RepID=A0ACB8QRY6_9AGAM|nr:hypothetical protein K488DRAFT_83900 [Vararia minispora EC-137]
MQRLGIRVSFTDLPQSLAALGDRSEAWSGLGACLLTIYNNSRFRVTLTLPLIAAIYFAALSTLGFSSSFLFSIPTFNSNSSFCSRTTIGTPDVLSLIPPAAGPNLPSNFQNISFDWFSSSAGLSILAGGAAPEFPGLIGSRVFDTIASNISNANATAVVGYTDFHVKSDNASDPINGQMILDATGSPGWPTSMTISSKDLSLYPNATFYVQMIGCSVSITSGTAAIDAGTNRLVNISDLSTSESGSLWEKWLPDTTSSNQLEDTWAWMFMPNSSMPMWYESRDVNLLTGEGFQANEWSCAATLSVFGREDGPVVNSSGCHVPTVMEQYRTGFRFTLPRKHLIEPLFYSVSNALLGASAPNTAKLETLAFQQARSLKNGTSSDTLTLQRLESALANATAMTMWSAARASTLTTYIQDSSRAFAYLNSSHYTRVEPRTGTALVNVVEKVGLVEINSWVLYLGTSAAVILLAIAVYVVLRSASSVYGHAPPVDSVSLLHIAALDTSAIAPRFADVDMGSMLARRRAGTFPVAIVNGAIIAVDGDA